MLIISLILATSPPTVPGAIAIERIADKDMAETARRSLRSRDGISVVSDDGRCVFVNEGRIGQYYFDNPAFAKREDILTFLIDGKPLSLTTSQYSHVSEDIKARPMDRGTRDVFAANSHQMFVGMYLGDLLRLTIVNLNKRGKRPNFDTDIQTRAAGGAKLMRVSISGAAPKWYICHAGWQPSTPNKPSVVAEVRFSGERPTTRRLGICAPGGFSDFDPRSKLLLAQGPSNVIIGRLGSQTAIKAAQPERPEGVGLNAFLWHGKVMAQTDRLYVRDSDRKWKPFGSEFVVLAKSANEKYWLILDPFGSAWKVTF